MKRKPTLTTTPELNAMSSPLFARGGKLLTLCYGDNWERFMRCVVRHWLTFSMREKVNDK